MTDTPMPASVQVGPVRYSVACDEAAIVRRRAVDEDNDIIAWCDHVHRQIEVWPNQPAGSARTSLAHEVVHAIYNVYGLSGEPADERHVRVVANAWVDLLQRNPQLVAYLTQAGD